MRGMANIFKRFKNVCGEFLIADLLPELAQCEDGCRVTECSHGEWLTCENRIRRLREEIRLSRSKGAKALSVVDQPTRRARASGSM